MCQGVSNVSANSAAFLFRVNDFGEVLAALIKCILSKIILKPLTMKMAAEKFVETLKMKSPPHSTRPSPEGVSFRRDNQRIRIREQAND
jgi:hypothetical protein